ncbi:MAG: hypothetical protein JO354_01670 [Verrucomicrobia bacterium]|nr:hypothetical protein [Verrucomicrobiota bacterium]
MTSSAFVIGESIMRAFPSGKGFLICALLMLLVGLPACSKTLPLALPDNVDVQVVVYEPSPGSNSPERKTLSLTSGSPEYRQLQAWFEQNQNGWSQGYPTRPTGGVFVNAGDLHLQFVGKKVLLFSSKGAFEKKVSERDYAFLTAISRH